MKDRSKLYERLGRKFIRLDTQEKKVKESKDKIRKELSDAMRAEWTEKEFLRPTVTETIPNSFFEITGIGEEEFLATRYPGWELISTIEQEDSTVYVLRKKPEYMGKVIELEDSQITKIVVEYSPEIDWKSLEKEFPDIVGRIGKKVETMVVDEEALEQETKNNPEIFSILRRHMRVRQPTNKFLPKRNIDGTTDN